MIATALYSDEQLKKLCRARGGELWEDVLHETIINVSQSEWGAKARPGEELTKYACKVAINIINTHRRAESRQREVFEGYREVLPTQWQPDTEVFTKEEYILQKINRDINTQNKMFAARLYAMTRKKSYLEVAVFCNLITREGKPAVSVVKAHVSRYKKELREYAKNL